jgi:hypothetical protein
MRRLALLLGAAACLSACVTPPKPLYAWGSYEELIYTAHATPGAGDAQTQVTALEKDYQVARSTNQPLPPGWHAHLGYLYFQLGKTDQALQEFNTEKVQFPESKVLMDRLIAKVKKP